MLARDPCQAIFPLSSEDNKKFVHNQAEKEVEEKKNASLCPGEPVKNPRKNDDKRRDRNSWTSTQSERETWKWIDQASWPCITRPRKCPSFYFVVSARGISQFIFKDYFFFTL